MSYASDRAASRYARDRDLLPDDPRMGPYELRYDVRRGYEGTAPIRPPRDTSAQDVLFFRAREDRPPAD
ncbi:hypothetical protein [Longimicrobium sp.]|uniref:hypothetical protein n=1 Tax=Longimicrobium sp. TaxID=2029185 RepID=UPI003B3A5B7C